MGPQRNKPLRVKTIWFKKAGETQSPEKTSSVVASTIWRLSDAVVINLSKADYDIITPQRGFKIIGEMIAFLVHITDRMLYGRVEDQERGALMQALGLRLADVMVQNIHEVTGDDGFDYRGNFLAFLNKRAQEYATFEFDPANPNFSVLRYLGHCLLEIMEDRDQPWVIDQIMELESPQAIETLQKTIDGLFLHA